MRTKARHAASGGADPFDLRRRFVEQQKRCYRRALAEIRGGSKNSHWSVHGKGGGEGHRDPVHWRASTEQESRAAQRTQETQRCLESALPRIFKRMLLLACCAP